MSSFSIDNVTIRSFRHDDLVCVSKVDKEAFGKNSYPTFFIQQASDVFNDLFCVAETGGKIIGFSLGAIRIDKSKGWILGLAVKKKYRRMGVAEKLTQYVIQAFYKYGVNIIFLTVDPKNTGAIKLYLKLNFYEVEMVDDYFGPDEPRIVMCKKLDSSIRSPQNG